MSKSYIDSMLGTQEKVVAVSRQHWFILASAIALEVILIIAIFATTIFMAIVLPPPSQIIVGLLGFVLLLIPIATMTHDIMKWSNRQFIITNRRVMQISGIFNKNVSDSSLEKVNDIKLEQSALGRIFDYGDVEILTASELGVNRFPHIQNPVGFKTAMINSKEKLDHGEAQPETTADIPSLITKLAALRDQGLLTAEEFEAKKTDLLSKM